MIDFRSNESRRNIGVDFHTFDGIFQGSRSHVIGLFKQVVRLAPELGFTFFLDDPARLLSEHPEFAANNVRMVRMRHASGPMRLAVQLPWLQWRHRIDLLHTQYRIPFIASKPCACTIHDVLFESHPEFFTKFFTLQSKLSFRLAARQAKLLFTVSEFSRTEIARRYKVAPGRIRVLYNGVDRTRFFPGSEGHEALDSLGLKSGGYLLTVGRLEPRKNHLRLIEAHARLGKDAPPLICVGQRDFGFAAAFDAVARLGLTDRVRFLEHVGDDLLPVLMRNSRVFIFPAIAEGFGMPVAEALASGVPVVTSRSTSLPEVAGNAAVLVDPLDVGSIFDGIAKVLSDPGLEARLRTEGPVQAGKFDWTDSARILVASYREFLGIKTTKTLAAGR